MFKKYPVSILSSDRRWMLVIWSAEFARLGPKLAQRLLLVVWSADFATKKARYLYILLTLGQHLAHGRFLFKILMSRKGDFGKLSKKLFIMVCLKSHFSPPTILTNYLTSLDIKIIFSLQINTKKLFVNIIILSLDYGLSP